MRLSLYSSCRAKGYTLLELLVVLGILVLIIGIATPLVLSQFGKAKVDAARVQVNALSGNVEFFILDVGRAPSTEEGLQALLEQPAGLKRWQGPYVKKVGQLTDPWGNPYQYKLSEAGEFEILSYGADGAAGGEGTGADVSSLE